MAHEALAAARLEVDNGLAARAVSSAYYAMLNAVQAALSEEDRYAKTHAGLWSQFGETFVVTGRFDAGLAKAARRSQAPSRGCRLRRRVRDDGASRRDGRPCEAVRRGGRVDGRG